MAFLNATQFVMAISLCAFQSASSQAASSIGGADMLPLASNASSVSRPIDSRRIIKVPACQLQNGKRLPRLRYRAAGTEPFWSTEIDGRCVTYLSPEAQKGVRIWTRYTSTSRGKMWVGYYDGRRFELRLSNAAASRCSDGMSEKNYRLIGELRLAGKYRRGCAEPR